MSQAYQPDKTRVPCGVAAIIRDSAGRTFMIKRTGSTGEGKWSVPGGWISESDVEVEDAVIRECWEEVGIKIPSRDDLLFLGVMRDIHHERGKDPVHDVCLWYRVERYEGTPRNCNPERISDVGWAGLDLRPYAMPDIFLPLRNAIIAGIV